VQTAKGSEFFDQKLKKIAFFSVKNDIIPPAETSPKETKVQRAKAKRDKQSSLVTGEKERKRNTDDNRSCK